MLKARGWPLGEARVEIEVVPDGPQTCTVSITEDATSGPGLLVPLPARQAMILPRNREALQAARPARRGPPPREPQESLSTRSHAVRTRARRTGPERPALTDRREGGVPAAGAVHPTTGVGRGAGEEQPRQRGLRAPEPPRRAEHELLVQGRRPGVERAAVQARVGVLRGPAGTGRTAPAPSRGSRGPPARPTPPSARPAAPRPPRRGPGAGGGGCRPTPTRCPRATGSGRPSSSGRGG